MYYLEYCHERNEELSESCEYKYYVLHYAGMGAYADDNVYDSDGGYVVLKVYKL